jgi:hypothetical protein
MVYHIEIKAYVIKDSLEHFQLQYKKPADTFYATASEIARCGCMENQYSGFSGSRLYIPLRNHILK